MKTLRYLLIVMMVVLSSVSAKAQLAQDDDMGFKFYSTSPLPASGTGLPQAAVSGTTFAGEAPAAYAPGSPRRAADGDDGDTPPTDPKGPNENPIGDGVWAMLLMAAGYLLYRVRTRKREVTA